MDAFEKEASPAAALRKATDELSKAVRSGSKRDEVLALIHTAEALLGKDGPQAGLHAVAAPLAAARKMGYQDLERKALHLAVLANVVQGKAGKAIEAGTELLDLAEKQGDKSEVAAAKRTMVRARALGNSLGNAMQDANDALAIYREKGDLKEQAKTLLVQTEVCSMEGDAEGAERKAKGALRLFKEADYSKGASAALEVLVELYTTNGQFKAAREIAKDELSACAGRDKHGEAMAMRSLAMAHLASDDLEEAERLAGESLKRFVELGDRNAEGFMMVALASIYANMGRAEDAVAMTKQALSLYKKLGSFEGEKAALQLLFKIHEAKGMDPPSLIAGYRTESLDILREIGRAIQDKSSEAFYDAATRLGKIGSFYTKKDVLDVVGPLETEDTIDFVKQLAPTEVVEYLLQSVKVETQLELSDEQTARKPIMKIKETDKLFMYSQLRMGMLVYGPRFRQIEAFIPFSGFMLVHAIVRPSSLCEDWEQEGWDWNPAVIDAAAHSGFAMTQAAFL